MVRASRNVSIIVQQDATIYSLFISGNCCTSLGWYLHPSSAAHITVSTDRYCHLSCPIRSRSRQVAVAVSVIPDTVYTVI